MYFNVAINQTTLQSFSSPRDWIASAKVEFDCSTDKIIKNSTQSNRAKKSISPVFIVVSRRKKNSTDFLQRKPVERSSRTFTEKLLVYVLTDPIEERPLPTPAHVAGKGLSLFLIPLYDRSLHNGSGNAEITPINDPSHFQTADDMTL